MPTGFPPATPRRAGLAGLALIAVLAAAFWWPSRADAPQDAAALAGDAPAAPLELTAAEVVTVARHELVRRLPVSGSLAPLLRTVVKNIGALQDTLSAHSGDHHVSYFGRHGHLSHRIRNFAARISSIVSR